MSAVHYFIYIAAFFTHVHKKCSPIIRQLREALYSTLRLKNP